MNSKIFFSLLILLITLGACGVKSPPLKYPETVIESYVRSYTGSEPTAEELTRAKKDKINGTSPVPAMAPTLLPKP